MIWLDNLLNLISKTPLEGYTLVVMSLAITGVMIWVSLDDILYQEIYFWKLLVAGASTIILPAIASLIFKEYTLALCIFGSLFLWLGFLFINILLNNDGFVGKADVDIISAVGSLFAGASLWLYLTQESAVSAIQISYIWYNFFLYLLLGSLVVIFIFLLWFGIRVLQKKAHIALLLRFTKVAVIPMLLPISIIGPLIILTIK